MIEVGFWTRFVVAVLATWRITHLLAREDGPADLIVRLRNKLGGSWVGRLMDCFYCLGVWIAAPMAFFVARKPLELLLTWLAISGAACLLERIGQQPVVIQPVSQAKEEGDVYGMLRSETSEPQQHLAAADNTGRDATPTE